jgi:hypothetical protein
MIELGDGISIVAMRIDCIKPKAVAPNAAIAMPK